MSQDHNDLEEDVEDINHGTEPPEVIVVHKETFLACIKALTIYLSNSFDYYNQVKKSGLDPQAKKMMLDILKTDLDTIGNVSNALEQSMDYKAEVDVVKNEFIN